MSALFRPISFFWTKAGLSLLLMLALMFWSALRFLLKEQEPSQAEIEQQWVEFEQSQCIGFSMLNGTLDHFTDLRVVVLAHLYDNYHLMLACLTFILNQMLGIEAYSPNAQPPPLNITPQIAFSGYPHDRQVEFSKLCTYMNELRNISCLNLAKDFKFLEKWYEYCRRFKEQMALAWVYHLLDMRGTWNYSVRDAALEWANGSLSKLWFSEYRNVNDNTLGIKRFGARGEDPSVSERVAKELERIFSQSLSPVRPPLTRGELELCIDVIKKFLLSRQVGYHYSYIFQKGFLAAKDIALWNTFLSATDFHHLYSVLLTTTQSYFQEGMKHARADRYGQLFDYINRMMLEYYWLIIVVNHPPLGKEDKAFLNAVPEDNVSDLTALQLNLNNPSVAPNSFAILRDEGKASPPLDPKSYYYVAPLANGGIAMVRGEGTPKPKNKNKKTKKHRLSAPEPQSVEESPPGARRFTLSDGNPMPADLEEDQLKDMQPFRVL